MDTPSEYNAAALLGYVEWADYHLDDKVGPLYKEQPLAQDWARVTKTAEEAGEAITELIAITGQNPRKGVHSSQDKLLKELADTALAALYAIQHFTKDVHKTWQIVMDDAKFHKSRIEDGTGIYETSELEGV